MRVYLHLAGAVVGSLVLSACGTSSLQGPAKAAGTGHTQTASSAPVVREAPVSLAQCRSELQSLRGVDAALYNRNKARLDAVTERASRYTVMRDRLGADMQDVMDSVYQAQLARLCHQIHSDLFSALLQHADAN